MRKCKECKEELNGTMIFYPKLCLSCVINLDTHEEKDELKKAIKKQKDFLNHKIEK